MGTVNKLTLMEHMKETGSKIKKMGTENLLGLIMILI